MVKKKADGSYKTTKKMDLVEGKSYYSKHFNIITSWDGGSQYTVDVYNAEGTRLEHVEVWDDSSNLRLVDDRFEQLKTKYILDYDNKAPI